MELFTLLVPSFSIVLLIVIFFSLRKTIKTSATKNPRLFKTKSGKDYEWEVSTHKGSATSSWLYIDAQLPAEFQLEKEGALHRFSKAFGFCSEFQTSDENFNNHVFIMCDSNAMRDRIAMDSKFKQAVTEALANGARRITYAGKRLGILMQQASFTIKDDQAETLVAALEKIRDSMRAVTEMDDGWLKSRYLYRGFLALYVLLAAGALALMFINSRNGYSLFDWAPFWPLFAQCAVIAVIVLMIAIRVIAGGTSYGHKIFMFYLFFGLWGSLAAVGTGIVYVNAHYDTSQPSVHYEYVIDKYTTTRKRSTSYYIVVKDWKHNADTRSFATTSDFYHRIKGGERMAFILRAGYLNIEWIEAYKVTKR